MRKNARYKIILAVAFCAGFLLVRAETSFSASSADCTDLSYDLGYASNDSKTKGEVTKLQSFLKAQGYFSATPNGNFGPATLAAVKKFQTASGVISTGYVGPLTRMALYIKSCTQKPESSANQSPNVVVTNVVTSPKVVKSPAAGDKLLIGQYTRVEWTSSGYTQDIVLEDESGVAQGFVTPSIGGTVSYLWKAGTVFSSKARENIIVQPGKYRIRVRGSGDDQVSGLFVIEAQPMIVKSIMPKEIVADGSSSAVIYGSGFPETVAIFIDNRYATNAVKLYSSTDGKIIVFAIPANVPAGTHEIILDNTYGTSISAGHVTVTSSGNSQ